MYIRIVILCSIDPAWARKDYGNVSDYSGKMAAAGCGVVAITNAVYALNGQFVDPMLFADYAVEKHYRIIGAEHMMGFLRRQRRNLETHMVHLY